MSSNFNFNGLDDDDDLDLGIGGDTSVTGGSHNKASSPVGTPVRVGQTHAHNPAKKGPSTDALTALRKPEQNPNTREQIQRPDFLKPPTAPTQQVPQPKPQAPAQAAPSMPAPPVAPRRTMPAPPSMPAAPKSTSYEELSETPDYVTAAPPAQPQKRLAMPGRSAAPAAPAQEPAQPPRPAAPQPVYNEPEQVTAPSHSDPYAAEDPYPSVYSEPEYTEPAYTEPTYQEQPAYSEPVYEEPAQPRQSYGDPRTSGIYDAAASMYRGEEVRPTQPPRRRSEPRELFRDEPARRAVADEEEEPTTRKGRSNRKATPKKGKGGKQRPPKKQGAFSGGRGKVLALRIGIFAAIGVLTLLGVKSILLPASGPTKTQVMSAAQEALGQTGFPQEAGEGFATAFTKTFLNVDPTNVATRDSQLLNYAPKDVLSTIDLRYRSADDKITSSSDSTATTPSSGTETEGLPAADTTTQPAQIVTQGPYFVGANNVDETHSVITTLTQVNNAQWFYLQVPLIYDPDTKALAVSASPTFLSPTQVAKVPANAGDPTWQDDKDVVTSFQSDLQNYLIAWAASDSTVISRYLTTDASVDAKAGLHGTVKFSRLAVLSVESVGPDSLTPNTRRAQADVVWIDPATNLVYTQSYRLIIEKQPDGRWYVNDITNLALIPGNAAVNDEQAAQ